MIQPTSANRENQGRLVPGTWQPQPPRLRSPRVIPWPVAVLIVPLLWLMPRRFGPAFSLVRWPGPLLAHLLCSLYGLGWLGLVSDGTRYTWISYLRSRPPVSLEGWEQLCQVARWPLAWLVNRVEALSQFGSTAMRQDMLMLVAAELALLLSPLLLLPVLWSGERPLRLFGRLLKLALWCSTLLVPAAALADVWSLAGFVNRADWGFAIAFAWGCWVMFRAGLDAVAPADERLTRERPLLCRHCGYALEGLQLEGHCPECGTAVEESLPESTPVSPYAQARGIGGRIATWWQIAYAGLMQPGYFRTIALEGSYTAARNMALHTGLVLAPVIFVAVALAVPPRDRSAGLLVAAGTVVGTLVAASPLLLLLIRNPLRLRRVATVWFHAAAWIMALAIPLVGASVLFQLDHLFAGLALTIIGIPVYLVALIFIGFAVVRLIQGVSHAWHGNT